MTADEAQKIIDAEKAERAQACLDEIKEMVQRYRCDVIGVPRYVAAPNGFVTVCDVQVVAK